MLGTIPAAMGAGRSGIRRLIGSGFLGAEAVFARASRATSFDASSLLSDVAADVPRFPGTARRLMIEGARTNGVRNPRAEGGAPGTLGAGGSAPSNWTLGVGSTGLLPVISYGTENGLPYLQLDVSGVPTGTSSVDVFCDTTSAIAAAPSQSLVFSAFLKLHAGSLAGVATDNRVQFYNSVPTFLSDTGASATWGGGGLGTSRFQHPVTAVADTAFVRSRLRFNLTSGVAVSFTVRMAAPAFETGAFASSPILPPALMVAAATRAADILTASVAALFPAGAGTLLWSGTIPQAAPAGVEQILAQLDAGSDSNRIRLRNAAGGLTLVADFIAGGVAAGTLTLGSMVAGVPFKVALAWSGTGLSGLLAGGTVQTASATAPAGLTTLRFGNNVAGASGLFGEVASASALSYRAGDASLSTLLGALS
ncbi:hypothetical protein C8P66_14810 [Humitalea rosea]|uniref:Uncharacterized protein n=2 Tax=Humitalea rosea TaxID=990373 RepID=A0A2W7IFJ5_9PROT|nr:hypothetical protein C8P66_14810 [Humitalea rosea]